MARLTTEQLQAILLNEEEDTRLEFKRSDKLYLHSASYKKPGKDQTISILKTLSAFANSNGGRMIFGVINDQGPKSCDDGVNLSAWKQENKQELELWLRSQISAHVQRDIPGVDIYFLDIPNSLLS